MAEAIETSPQSLVEPGVITALETGIAAAEKAVVLARLRRRVEKNRATLQAHVRMLSEMAEEAEKRLLPEGLVLLASRVRGSRKAAAEQLEPWIRSLQQALVVPSAEGRQQIQALIDISMAWLATYDDAQARLIELAAAGEKTNAGILRARPLAGQPDHEVLTREIIARFPKILAALAK